MRALPCCALNGCGYRLSRGDDLAARIDDLGGFSRRPQILAGYERAPVRRLHIKPATGNTVRGSGKQIIIADAMHDARNRASSSAPSVTIISHGMLPHAMLPRSMAAI
jgi:hypothetical protein